MILHLFQFFARLGNDGNDSRIFHLHAYLDFCLIQRKITMSNSTYYEEEKELSKFNNDGEDDDFVPRHDRSYGSEYNRQRYQQEYIEDIRNSLYR